MRARSCLRVRACVHACAWVSVWVREEGQCACDLMPARACRRKGQWHARGSRTRGHTVSCVAALHSTRVGEGTL